MFTLSGGQVTFTPQPSSPSEVNEGGNLTLQWNYNLVGGSPFAFVIANVTDGGSSPPSVVTRQSSSVATVQPGFEDRFRAAISDTQANLTILEVPRSETENKYLLRILRTADLRLFPSDVVEIKVLCKYTVGGHATCLRLNLIILKVFYLWFVCRSFSV